MSEADKMFEELGYELTDEKICPHSYRYIKETDKFRTKEIVIEKSNKLITICYYKVDLQGYIEPLNLIEYHLSLQELQAINKKCEELRMDMSNIEDDVNELKRLLYSDTLTQYGKRKLVNYYEQRIQELEEERQLVGIPVRNKRDGKIGIVLHQWENGSIAVLERINPRIINTHDSWNTLEIITDEVKQVQTQDDTISKQVIIDKIKEVHNMKFEDDRLNGATIDFAVHKFEELLEGEGK